MASSVDAASSRMIVLLTLIPPVIQEPGPALLEGLGWSRQYNACMVPVVQEAKRTILGIVAHRLWLAFCLLR